MESVGNWIGPVISIITLIISVGSSTALLYARINVLETRLQEMKENIDRYRTQFVPRTECDIRDAAMQKLIDAMDKRIKFLEENRSG